jgi:hypothetical protein
VIPALNDLIDAILACQDAYSHNDAEWDALMAHDTTLQTDWCDLFDDMTDMIIRLATMRDKAQVLIDVDRICKMLGDEK